jgi:hypothetical protein
MATAIASRVPILKEQTPRFDTSQTKETREEIL